MQEDALKKWRNVKFFSKRFKRNILRKFSPLQVKKKNNNNPWTFIHIPEIRSSKHNDATHGDEYPKIKDKSNRWRRTPHQRFQEYFPPLPKARPNSEHGFTRIYTSNIPRSAFQWNFLSWVAYFWFTHDLLALGARTHAHTGDKKEDSPSLPYRLPRIPRDH